MIAAPSHNLGLFMLLLGSSNAAVGGEGATDCCLVVVAEEVADEVHVISGRRSPAHPVLVKTGPAAELWVGTWKLEGSDPQLTRNPNIHASRRENQPV